MFKHLDFKFYKVDFIAIAVLVASLIWANVFAVDEILENTIYENIAIIPLFLGIVLCLRAKKYKTFFTFIALILFLMIAREFNYGRVLFCQLPDNRHDFYPWSHYKYGFLAHIIVGIYITASCLWAVINKIWVDIIEIIKNIKFPFYTLSGCIFMTIAQIYCERFMHNTAFEEIAEFTLYCLLFSLVYIYTKKIIK